MVQNYYYLNKNAPKIVRCNIKIIPANILGKKCDEVLSRIFNYYTENAVL